MTFLTFGSMSMPFAHIFLTLGHMFLTNREVDEHLKVYIYQEFISLILHFCFGLILGLRESRLNSPQMGMDDQSPNERDNGPIRSYKMSNL